MLSISQITREKQNLIVEIQVNTWLIKDMAMKFKVVVQGFKENGMYNLDTSNRLQQNMNASVVSIGKLWRKRFGHINHNYLDLMKNLNMVIGLPFLKQDKSVCEACILGKQHKNTFDKDGSWRSRRPLELVHSDLCGSMQAQPLAGSKYFFTFIDDYSWKIWVYFLKNKFEVFEKIVCFKSMVEKESNYKLKCLKVRQLWRIYI